MQRMHLAGAHAADKNCVAFQHQGDAPVLSSRTWPSSIMVWPKTNFSRSFSTEEAGATGCDPLIERACPCMRSTLIGLAMIGCSCSRGPRHQALAGDLVETRRHAVELGFDNDVSQDLVAFQKSATFRSCCHRGRNRPRARASGAGLRHGDARTGVEGSSRRRKRIGCAFAGWRCPTAERLGAGSLHGQQAMGQLLPPRALTRC